MRVISIIAMLLSHLCWAQGEESVTWEIIAAHKSSEKELRALPTITIEKTNETRIYLRIENRTGVDIEYYGYGKETPQKFFKDKRDGKWVATAWDWCGTGMERYVMKDQTTITFEIETSKYPVQVFTIFRNAKDSKEFSLVKLYQKDGG